jgi:Mg2+-importing ATPase
MTVTVRPARENHQLFSALWRFEQGRAFEMGIENPLDAAIVAAGKITGLTTQGFAKIDEIPYDFLRRQLTIVVAQDGNLAQHLIVTKGAFSNVLDTCSSLERDAVDTPITTELRIQLDAVVKAKGAEGFRVLAVATRKVAAKPRYGRDDTGHDVSRLSGFLRPAKGRRTTDDPRSRQARHPHKSH